MMRRRATSLARLLLAWTLALVAVPALAQTRDYAVETAVVATIDSGIGPATTRLVEEALEEASAHDGGMLVLRMDTPGGLTEATRDIVETILAAPVPVVVHVAPQGGRAASAGTYILYASHLAAMAPGTTLGAATPVGMGGALDEDLRRKVVNDAASFIVGLAELRGRDADFAERAVREAATLTAPEAIQEGVVEILADDTATLVREAHGFIVRLGETPVRLETDGALLVAHEPSLLTRALALLTDPDIAYILLLIGIYGIVFEFANPGMIFSGVIGAIALILGLYAMNLLPIDVTGVLLVALGIVLMIAEAFVPAFGMLGIGGAAAFAFGSWILFDGDVPGFTLSPLVIAGGTLVTALLFGFVLATAIRALMRRPASGDRALADEIGVVLSWEGLEGAVEIHGERWRARAEQAFAPGDRVRLHAREGLTLYVGPAPRDPVPFPEPPERIPEHPRLRP